MNYSSNHKSELPGPCFEATTVSFLTSSFCFNFRNILQLDQEAKFGHLAALLLFLPANDSHLSVTSAVI
jgi:hypothetical protein